MRSKHFLRCHLVTVVLLFEVVEFLGNVVVALFKLFNLCFIFLTQDVTKIILFFPLIITHTLNEVPCPLLLLFAANLGALAATTAATTAATAAVTTTTIMFSAC